VSFDIALPSLILFGLLLLIGNSLQLLFVRPAQKRPHICDAIGVGHAPIGVTDESGILKFLQASSWPPYPEVFIGTTGRQL
jgi:hypothetical protein